MRALVLAVTLLAVALLAVASAQDPVPPGMVSGQTLTLDEANCAVDAPPGWTWKKGANTQPGFPMYLTRSSDDRTVLMIMCQKLRSARFSRNEADLQARGMMHGFDKSGGKSSGLEVMASDVPRPGSFRFAFRTDRADGGVIYARGYLLHVGEDGHCLMSLSPDPSEAPELAAFAGSFRVLAPPPTRAENPGAACAVIFFYCFLQLGGWVAGKVLNAVVGRRVVSPSNLGIVFVLVAFAAICTASVLIARAQETVDAHALGYRVGFNMGGVFFPLIFWVMTRSSAKAPPSPAT